VELSVVGTRLAIVPPAIAAAPAWVHRMATSAEHADDSYVTWNARNRLCNCDEAPMRSYFLHRRRMTASVLALVFLSSMAHAQANDQKTFATENEALAGLVNAVRAGDASQLQAILGPDSEQITSSGDAVADRHSRDTFLQKYETKHTLTSSGENHMTLNIGEDMWPVPIPLVHSGDKWYWDGAAGEQEIVYRRIGHNELDAINVCKGVLAAQKDYAAESHDGNTAGTYAARIVSQPGTQNGLYWDVKEGESPSPAGPMLANAEAQGYDTSKITPYHGYYYRMLKNPDGFGFLAYPAQYRTSGVMTFQVSQKGIIYQKDLGEKTADIAQQLTDFKIDSTWKPVR
jgi:hypothetical protein